MDTQKPNALVRNFGPILFGIWLATVGALLHAAGQAVPQRQAPINARDGLEPFLMAVPPAVTLTPGCDLDTLRATLAKLTSGELAAVGYVGDDGNWHALTADVLRGR